MIALGLLVVLIGFAFVVPRSSMPGATAHRNVILGMQRVFQTPGYGGQPTRKYRVFQVLLGLAVMAGGIAIIATAG